MPAVSRFRIHDPAPWLFAMAAGAACAAYLVFRLVGAPDLLSRSPNPISTLVAVIGGAVPPEVATRAALAAIIAFGLPLAVGSAWHWRERWLALVRRPVVAPEGWARRRRQRRDLAYRVMVSYLGHALFIILPFLGITCAQRLGPPGGGGGDPGAEAQQEEAVQVVKVLRRRLIVNPHSAVILRQPAEIDLDLREETRRMATATATQAGGAGEGSGGYDGGEGAELRFVTLDHGGRGWDEAMDVAAPKLLAELRARLHVPAARRPDAVTVSDLAAQRDPAQQPPLIYLCLGSAAPRLGAGDLDFLRRYCQDVGGMLLLDDTGGGRSHAERIARTLFPGQPLVSLPKDDELFRGRQSLAAVAMAERALARHGGDRILGVREGRRWVLVYHPGDLVDGWRGAYGPEWQETAYRFGVNCFDAATRHFLARRKAEAGGAR